MTFTRRPATPEDKEAIYQINCAAYRDLVTEQFGVWDEAWQRAHFEDKWDPKKYFVICLGLEMIGVVAVEYHADHLFLSEIQIAPAFQNRGFGSELLKEIIAEAQQRSLPVRLRVLKLNRARNLYERLGFVQTSGTATHFYMEWREWL